MCPRAVSVPWPWNAPLCCRFLSAVLPRAAGTLGSCLLDGTYAPLFFLSREPNSSLIRVFLQSMFTAADRYTLIIVKSRIWSLWEEEIEAVEGGDWELHLFSWML